MKNILPAICLLIFHTNPVAHEFWLQPNKFIYKRGELIIVRFNTGKNFEFNNWDGDKQSVDSLQFYYGGVSDDLTDAMGDEKGDSIQLALMDEGTAMVTFMSRDASPVPGTSELNLAPTGPDSLVMQPAFMTEDSISPIATQLCVKTIFQVGTVRDITYKQETNLPLDIIPQSNPYALKNNQSLTVRITFRDRPLPNAIARLWRREKNRVTVKELRTNKDGQIRFPVKTSGEWMISCIKMATLKDDDGSNLSRQGKLKQYQASCTWGYK